MNKIATHILGWRRSRNAQVWALFVAYGFALLLLAFCAYWFRFDLNNIDGISYISIARQYADGQAGTALNAYWSPMSSWMMIPLLKAGLSGIFAFMVVNAIAAACGIAIGSLFIWRTTGRKFLPTLVFMFISTIFFAGTSFILTPDSMVVSWVILFVVTLVWVDGRIDLVDLRRRDLWIAGATLGAVGALGYVVKLFIVPVFAVTIIIWVAIRLWPRPRSMAAPRRPVLIALGSAVVTAVILCAPWAIALSIKYDEPTIGTSFAVNMESKFAPATGAVAGEPVNIVTPPNENAVSFGEDRTFQTASARAASTAEAGDTPAQGGSGVSAESKPKAGLLSSAKYYVTERIAAFPLYVNKIASIGPFAVLTLAGFALALIFGFVSYRKQRAAALTGIVAGVYFLGYAAITSASSGGGNSRYYWPVFVLATIMALLLAPEMWHRVKSGSRTPLRLIALALIVSLLPISALWQHGLGKAAPFSTGSGSSGLREQLADGNTKSAEQDVVESQLAEIIPADSDIMGSNYRTTLKLAYLLEAQVFGKSAMGYDPADPAFVSALRDNGIDYYLDFSPLWVKDLPDVNGIGVVVDSFEKVLPCSDAKSAKKERCFVRVVQVAPVQ